MAITRVKSAVSVVEKPEEGTETKTTVAASETPVQPDVKVIIFSVVAVLVFLFISIRLNNGINPDYVSKMKTPIADLTIFAFFYVIAQAIERVLEPFTSWILPTAAEVSDRDVKQATFEQKKNAETGKAAADAKATLAISRANRTVAFWGLSTCLGLLASGYLSLYFLRVIGVTDVPLAIEILVTGLVIGGGAKPLHDLISKIEKAKTTAEDQA